MTLSINGQKKDFPAPLSLAQLVDHLGMKPQRVATELNREIVARELWPTTELKDGDQLEIVHFVGGGAPVLESLKIRHISATTLL